MKCRKCGKDFPSGDCKCDICTICVKCVKKERDKEMGIKEKSVDQKVENYIERADNLLSEMNVLPITDDNKLEVAKMIQREEK